MSYILSHVDTGKDLVLLHTIDDVRRYLNHEKPKGVKVLSTKVHDGKGHTFKIREE